MKKPTDQDGKSRTAAGIDPHSYPEQHEVELSGEEGELATEVRAKARQLWLDKGQPTGQDNELWLEAERQLKADRADLKKGRQEGSVQR